MTKKIIVTVTNIENEYIWFLQSDGKKSGIYMRPELENTKVGDRIELELEDNYKIGALVSVRLMEACEWR